MFSTLRYRSFATVFMSVAWMQVTLHFPVSAAEEVIRIGGVRNVVVAISTSGDDLRIVVDMLAVKVFDSATNKKLNLQKARAFAMHALAKHLALGSAARFTVRGLEVLDASTTNNSYRLTLLVPRNGIASKALYREAPEKENANEALSVPAAGKEVAAKERPSIPKDEQWMVAEESSAAVLLTRTADYLDTLNRLRKGMLEELSTAQDKLREQDEFYSAIADIEERLDGVSESMFADIDADNLLLAFEQQELREAVEKQRAKLLQTLRAAVGQFDAQQETIIKESVQ